MSLIGYVFNKALQRNILAYIPDSWSRFRCLTSVIDQNVKNAALAFVSEHFENGSLFKDNDMKRMEQLTIINMFHKSKGDPNKHLSVQGESTNGSKARGRHAPVDASKQTVRFLLHHLTLK